LLVFEDIHWADRGLLDMIEHLAGRMHGRPVLLLTLARPDLLDSRPGWGGGLSGYISMPLQPLAGKEAEALAFNVLRGIEEGERQKRAATFAEMAEGNPLFIEQLAATLAERPTGSADAMPTTIRGIVTARLDALPEQEREALLTAAVMGKVFWRGPVERVADDAAGLGETLAALERRDLIRRETVSAIAGEQQYTFRHMMIRDAAYEMLPRGRRQALHADLARYLEQEAPGAGEAVAQMARHWREAGEGDRAVRYFIEAAEEAERGWAMEHAERLYKEALDLVGDEDGAARRDLRRRLALVYWRSFHREEPVERDVDAEETGAQPA
jgi:predicted ATPase